MLKRKIFSNKLNKDIKDYIEILDEYCCFQKNNLNPVMFYEDQKVYCEWLKDEFLKRDTKDFIAVGLYEEDQLIQIMIGYKIEVAWCKEIIEDTLPFYVIGLTYFRDHSWRIPGSKIVDLDEIITTHFEQQEFTKGFMTIKASNFLKKITSGVNLTDYINTNFTKTFKQNRHYFYVEKIFREQKDLDSYRFRALKALLPKRIKRPIVLLSFDVKPELKTY